MQLKGDPFTPWKEWKQNQMPTLYTPVNKSEILREKRFIVLLRAWEANADTHENFAYCVVQLARLGDGDQSCDGTVSGDVIGYNARLGKFELTLKYEVYG